MMLGYLVHLSNMLHSAVSSQPLLTLSDTWVSLRLISLLNWVEAVYVSMVKGWTRDWSKGVDRVMEDLWLGLG